MKIITTTQGGDDWLAARRGHITASMIDAVVAGRHTKKFITYREELALDVAGVPDFSDTETKPWFEDGKLYESWARGWYSWETKQDVAQTGFCESDEYPWLGMSPDGIVEARVGGLEIKFRKTLTTFRKHSCKPLERGLVNQIQAQMWVAGWEWVDLVNFWRDDQHDDEKGAVRRVYRDQARIDYLEERCLVFWAQVLERAGEIDPTALVH